MLTANRIHAQFDPWTMWNQLHGELNELWGARARVSETPLNLWSSEDEALVTVELPGRELDGIHVSVHRDIVTIELDEGAPDSPENATTVRVERTASALTRQVRLPFEVDAERVEATYDRGVLRIHLHRHESTMPTKVAVNAG